jgi:hypothetical protein
LNPIKINGTYMKKLVLLSAFTQLLWCANAQTTNGLIAKWSFNNGNANDEIGTNDGTVTGASLSTDRFGNPNMAYDFDGVDDYISFPSDIYFDGAFTVSAWANIRTVQSWCRLLDFGNGSNSDNVLLAFSGASSGNFVAEVIGGGQLYSNTTFPLNNWTFICVTLDSDNILSIYENNVLSSSMLVSLMPQNIIRTLNYLGKSNWGFDAYADGQIDDVRIYNRALSTSEIDDLFNEPNPATVGINESVSIHNQEIIIYPNPAKDVITISELPVGAELRVLDITGKIMFSTIVNSNQLTINTEDFTNGLYLIHLNHSGTTSTKKLIVNK